MRRTTLLNLDPPKVEVHFSPSKIVLLWLYAMPLLGIQMRKEMIFVYSMWICSVRMLNLPSCTTGRRFTTGHPFVRLDARYKAIKAQLPGCATGQSENNLVVQLGGLKATWLYNRTVWQLPVCITGRAESSWLSKRIVWCYLKVQHNSLKTTWWYNWTCSSLAILPSLFK